MVLTDIFRCWRLSFWRRFDRSLLAAVVHLLFVCYLVEGLRLHSFLQASASEFASLRAGAVMKELAEAWPDNLVVTLQRSAGGEVHLEASRDLPFEILAPSWATSLFMLIVGYLTSAPSAAKAWETPLSMRLIFTTETELYKSLMDKQTDVTVAAAATDQRVRFYYPLFGTGALIEAPYSLDTREVKNHLLPFAEGLCEPCALGDPECTRMLDDLGFDSANAFICRKPHLRALARRASKRHSPAMQNAMQLAAAVAMLGVGAAFAVGEARASASRDIGPGGGGKGGQGGERADSRSLPPYQELFLVLILLPPALLAARGAAHAEAVEGGGTPHHPPPTTPPHTHPVLTPPPLPAPRSHASLALRQAFARRGAARLAGASSAPSPSSSTRALRASSSRRAPELAGAATQTGPRDKSACH